MSPWTEESLKKQKHANILVGCAGWNLRKEWANEFPVSGTHLQRYAARFHAAEINSSFYRPHRTATYQRWAMSTPAHFRFAVKLPKQITHVNRLVAVEMHIAEFAAQTSGLNEKLGAVLVQLPPSLNYEAAVCETFFKEMRKHFTPPIVCEPRHASWFKPEVESMLQYYRIERVAADPSVVPEAAIPGGAGLAPYFRWHGHPRMYYSEYDTTVLNRLADELIAKAAIASCVWCIFDNTALGFATHNALQLCELLQARVSEDPPQLLCTWNPAFRQQGVQ